MTLISPGDCTVQYGILLWNRDSQLTKWQHLQCDTWLSTQLNVYLPIRENYPLALGWHAIEFAQTSATLEFYICFDFDHITAVDMSFCTSLRNFIQSNQPRQKKNWRHFDFKDGGSQPYWNLVSNNGFFEKPIYDFLYVVNRDHSSKLLTFLRKSPFCILATDRQTDRRTDGQHRCTKPLSLSWAAAW